MSIVSLFPLLASAFVSSIDDSCISLLSSPHERASFLFPSLSLHLHYLMHKYYIINLQELDLIKDESKVYKLIGSALVPQDIEEARANVNKRLEYIKAEE